jgi:hypothetical protein
MEKQPNSRTCFVCGVDNPIVPDGAPSACTSPSIPTTRGAASPASGPNRSTRAIPANYTAASSLLYWTSQLKFLYSLAFSLYDWVLLDRGKARSR